MGTDFTELALAEWGIWDDDVDEATLMGLAQSYVARKRWEANLVGMATIKYLAEALGGGEGNHGGQQRVSAQAMMAELGMGF